MKRWKVITGSQTALVQIGEIFAHYFGTGGIISGLWEAIPIRELVHGIFLFLSPSLCSE
jgi:hypothetical protein